MEYIEAPANWVKNPVRSSVFLAGGITGCPNWQRELTEMLRATDYVILNPRRDDFPIHDPSAAELQIRWEFLHLRRADLISFWFCKDAIQPIALFELGAWSTRESTATILIGVEPGYPREQDIYIQMSLLGRRVVSTLDDLAGEIKRVLL